jgi:DNA repair protein RecN (Recombination protein N)
VQRGVHRLQSLVSERNRLATDAREKTRREEYVRFQLTEIERVAPQPGEDDELMTARQVLGNAERLQRLCADTYTALYEGEEAALPTLAAVWKKLGELASIDPHFAPHLAAKDAVKSQLEDLAYFLRSYASAIDDSPGKLQDVRTASRSSNV